ncbi:hypothetical protein JQ599_09555 [Bradyrhizobium diazoefficiens]|nr:hypothetical protein [Bradyrhizobium diazoefficiens]MBR0700144.1 hypothetical protein [Bradyrhizobium diazoefficiens]MBR0768479.1 hypothetical protein [Bradyrhizobium diazoefficiens]
MMFVRPYTAREICEAIGITLDTLYRTRELRHTRDQLPRPITEHPLRWERTGFDAWLTRHHPSRPPSPANDPVRPPDAVTIEEHQALFHAAYATPPLDTRRQHNRR